MRLVVEHRPDVALLDIHMPGSGIQAARDITKAAPEVAVVMLTQSAEDDDLFDSLRAGASGYLLKDTDPTTLADKLRERPRRRCSDAARLVARIMDEFRAPDEASLRTDHGRGRQAERPRVGGHAAARAKASPPTRSPDVSSSPRRPSACTCRPS